MTPKRRTQAERSADTQARLLDATIDCIVELGWTGASTTAICEHAGVSRGAQLHHFPRKSELVAAAIERLFDERHRQFRRLLATAPSLETALAELWRVYTGKTFYAWAELLVASRTEPELRAQLREVDDRFFAEATRTCRELLGTGAGERDQDVASLTRLILSALDGLALNHTLGGRDTLAAGVLEQLAILLAARTPGAPTKPRRPPGS